MKQVIGDQGEVRIAMIDHLPAGMKTESIKSGKGGYIIGHSESDHHHVLESAVKVMERTSDVPTGMRILYAILDEPSALVHNAPAEHDRHELPTGIVEFRIGREYDPFTEQARKVAANTEFHNSGR